MSSRFNELVYILKDWDIKVNVRCNKCLSETARICENVGSVTFVDGTDNCDFPERTSVMNEKTKIFDVSNIFDMLDLLFNVKTLSFYIDFVGSELLSYIGDKCTEVTKLTIEFLRLDQNDHLVGFSNLEELVVTRFKICSFYKDCFLTGIVSLPKLRHLSLNGIQNTKIFYHFQLPKFRNLQRLTLTGDLKNIRKRILSVCSSDLRDINIQDINDEEIQVLLDNCPNLKSVLLKGPDRGLSGLSLMKYAEFFQRIGSSLEQLIINWGVHFSPYHIKPLVESNLPALRVIDLDVSGISNDFIPLLKKLGKQLEFCKITGTMLLDEALIVSAEECTRILKQGFWADISGSNKLSQPGISKFLEICGPDLEGLFASGTPIVDKHLEELALHCPNLCQLDLGCTEVTGAGVLNFLQQLKGMGTYFT